MLPTIIGGSWVVLSRVIHPVYNIVAHLQTVLITTHEPPRPKPPLGYFAPLGRALSFHRRVVEVLWNPHSWESWLLFPTALGYVRYRSVEPSQS